jgi:hypothetical protein
LQRLLNLGVSHLVHQLGQVLHTNLGHRTRTLTGLLSLAGIGQLRSLASLLTILNDHVTINLVDFDRVGEVSLLVDYDLIFELLRVG